MASWQEKMLELSSSGEVILAIKVTPKASHTELKGVEGDCLCLRVAAPPEKGQANKKAVEFLATLFGVAKSKVALIKGEASRHKKVSIRGISLEAARAAIAKAGVVLDVE